MTPIRTERLILRNWEERDRDLFHRINSDERVIEFFDFRRDRATADAFLDRLRGEIARDGYGWSAAEIAASGECIGFIISFAVAGNKRSTAVMERLGMTRDPAADFDHPRVTDPDLKRHVLYRISLDEWLRLAGDGKAGEIPPAL